MNRPIPPNSREISDRLQNAGNPEAFARSVQQAFITIVIPCFNESEVFPVLVQRLVREIDSWGGRVEVLFVDDGSKDDTWKLILKL